MSVNGMMRFAMVTSSFLVSGKSFLCTPKFVKENRMNQFDEQHLFQLNIFVGNTTVTLIHYSVCCT